MTDDRDNQISNQETVKLDGPSSHQPPAMESTVIIGGPSAPRLSLEEAQAVVGDRYRIERIGGAGGMGQVFVAQDVRLERRVAIKFIDGPATDAGRITLLKEARSMAGLRHPSICPVHEAMVDGARPFIVMGWIDGIPLDQFWRGLDLKARLVLLEGVTEAVAEVHSAGLVHLDIKPSNILIDRTGTPVLVDFGLARSTGGSEGQSYGGTPGYAAPEQFEQGQPTGQPADVHALGTLLFVAMTDNLPWQADSAQAMVDEVAQNPPRLPEEITPGTPWPLQRIALSAIEHDPQRRYPDAQALCQDLARFRRGETVSARPSGLMNRFHDQVRRCQEETVAWSRQGLVTSREAELLDRIYDRMQRPESHWIADSRRLTLSQVLLYLGGWLVVLAMTVGAGFTWEALESVSWLRYTIPAAMGVCVLGLGVVFQLLGHSRIALGYLFTACLLTPIAVGLFLVEVSWWADPGDHGQLLKLVLHLSPILTNVQLLVAAATLVLAAFAGRQFLHATAFSPCGVIGLIVTAIAGWAALGLMGDTPDRWALFGLWLLCLGGLFLAAGIPLNRRQQRLEKLAAPGTERVFDAWSLLTGGVLLCVIGLTLTAWNSPGSYLPGLLPEPVPHHHREDVFIISAQSRSAAFIINGLLLLVLSWVLTCVHTTACGRLAELLRWIIPTHIIGGLLELAIVSWTQADRSDLVSTAAGVWLAAAALISMVFAVASVHRQWRPFLVSGLLGLASTYVILMMRLQYEFQDEPETFDAIAIGTVVALCLLGVGIMLISPRIRLGARTHR